MKVPISLWKPHTDFQQLELKVARLETMISYYPTLNIPTEDEVNAIQVVQVAGLKLKDSLV